MNRDKGWLSTWTRAVIAPAARRTTGVWIGSGIVGGIVFGPTGMHPHDFTQLALHVPEFGVAAAATWILLLVPTARVLVLAEGASYLRALPGPQRTALALAGLALIVLQLPWLALWLAGEGPRGLAIVIALTAVIAAVAAWRPRPPRAGWPRWRRDRAALRGVYLRGLRRRAGDALVRATGFALLAGLAAGLVARNNALPDREGAVLGASVIALALAPGWVGTLFPLLDVHRSSAWLAASLGMSAHARLGVLATLVAAIYVTGAMIASATAAIGFGTSVAWLGAVASVTALGASLIATRLLVWADRSDDAAGDAAKDAVLRGAATSRVAIGAVVASATAVLCLGTLGLAGVVAVVVIGAFALLTARPS